MVASESNLDFVCRLTYGNQVLTTPHRITLCKWNFSLTVFCTLHVKVISVNEKQMSLAFMLGIKLSDLVIHTM